MDIPKISDRTDLTFDECKAEFRQLKETLRAGNWATWLVNKIEDRLTFLRTKITDFVCEVQK